MTYRSVRERREAEMRLRNSRIALRRLQRRLSAMGHPRGDPYRVVKIAEFWEKLRFDKRMVKEEI
jgi:hypothetical protein